MAWGRDPFSGGVTVPPAVQERTRQRILAYAEKHYAGRYTRIDVRFRGALCYFDAYREPDVPANWPPEDWGITREAALEELRNKPVHLGRLRYFGNENEWGLAFFTYSNEKYTDCAFRETGKFYGTPEQGFETCAMYLR